MHSKEIEDYKRLLKLTPYQRDVLIGILLGDGHLETQNEGRTYRLKIEHSSKQRKYVEVLYNIFKEWTLTDAVLKKKEINGKIYENCGFSTVSHGGLRFYGQQFYGEDRKKRVPQFINKLLNPVGLAFWFMDDGSIKSYQSKGLILNTQGFTKTDVAILIKVLKTKFNIECKERKQKEGYQIYISGYSSNKFFKLIKNYLIPEMMYKIPSKVRLNIIA